MKWLRELKKDDTVVMVTFGEDGTEIVKDVKADYISAYEDDIMFRVYAGGRSFNHAGLCHGPDNTYAVIREKVK